jgi:hypothetical protein
MVMGDLCLTEDQVNPVMSVALDNGLEVTALHNHFFWDTPKVMFMHIGGLGDEAKFATAVGKVFAKIKETASAKPALPTSPIEPAKTTLDPAKIENVLGAKGELASGVYKVTIGRTAKMDGQAVGQTMGVNTWAAFAGSDERAIVDGDFAMLESELQGVLKALRGANINVVAIHQHMTHEQPASCSFTSGERGLRRSWRAGSRRREQRSKSRAAPPTAGHHRSVRLGRDAPEGAAAGRLKEKVAPGP